MAGVRNVVFLRTKMNLQSAKNNLDERTGARRPVHVRIMVESNDTSSVFFGKFLS